MPNSAYAHHDRITLSGITAVGFHGVLDFEKRDGQPFTVDATLYTDFADAAAGDDLEKTTNYAQVAELIHQKIVFGSLDLIETLAVRIAEGILSEFARIDAVEVKVSKPQAPITVPFENVAVSVFREHIPESLQAAMPGTEGRC